MCLLKDIKIDCKDFKFSVDYEDGSLYSKCSSKFGDDLLCTNHKELWYVYIYSDTEIKELCCFIISYFELFCSYPCERVG